MKGAAVHLQQHKEKGGGVTKVGERERGRAVPEPHLPPTYMKPFVHSKEISLGSLLQLDTDHVIV